MRIADHLGKLSWTLGDKALFLMYGFGVRLWQISLLPRSEFGLYGHLEVWHALIFTLSEGLALTALIKFGVEEEQRGSVNRQTGLLHLATCIGASLLMASIFLLFPAVPQFFGEPRLSDVALYLPLYVLVTIPRSYCLKFLLRDLQMRALFFVNLTWFATMATATAIFELTSGLRTFEDLALVHMVGALVSSLHLLWVTREQLVFRSKVQVNFKAILRFGRNQAGSMGLLSVGNMLDRLIIQKFFGTDGVGLYATAHTFFRAFDALRDGMLGLVYPGAVQLIARNDADVIRTFLGKAISFYLLVNVALFTALQIGLADFIIVGLLPEQYHSAAGLFKVLIIVALIHPFWVSWTYAMARGDTDKLLRFTIVATFAHLTTSWLVGMSMIQMLMPVPTIAMHLVLNILGFAYLRRHVHLTQYDLTRAVPDSLRYVKKLVERLRP